MGWRLKKKRLTRNRSRKVSTASHEPRDWDYQRGIGRGLGVIRGDDSARDDNSFGPPNSNPIGNHDRNNEETVPLAGVKIAVDHTTVTTDPDVALVLRSLPPGDVLFQILAARLVPAGVKLPV
jgi:hypothetical protein